MENFLFGFIFCFWKNFCILTRNANDCAWQVSETSNKCFGVLFKAPGESKCTFTNAGKTIDCWTNDSCKRMTQDDSDVTFAEGMSMLVIGLALFVILIILCGVLTVKYKVNCCKICCGCCKC